MARQVAWGTPGRSTHYQKLRRPHALLMVALALGFGLGGLLLAMHLAGYRNPVSPGGVASAHAPVEASCQECHASPALGASNLRCQRCHDPSGAGRLTQSAHVLFGSGDARRAAAAEGRRCAQCHVEHRGRAERLALVNERQCLECHFPSFAQHPEFAVLRAPTHETPGIKFPHEKHVKKLMETLGSPARTCTRCHEPEGRDMARISFDRHCASCHAQTGSVGAVDPVPQDDVAPAVGEGFAVNRGKVARPTLTHRDPWLVASLRKLRQELDPEGYAAERGALLARLSQLRRRLAFASPLAALDGGALKAREETIQLEIKGVEARLAAQAAAGDPGTGVKRLDDVAGVAALAGDAGAAAEAQALDDIGKGLGVAPVVPLTPAEHDARRRELLSALDAIDGADPSLRPRVEDLRRRVVSLAAGETGLAVLTRVRDQRIAELARVRDEIEMRRLGAAPPRAAVVAGQQRVIEAAIRDAELRLRQLPEVAPRALTAEERARKQESAELLAMACAKCHLIQNATLTSVRAAQPVLTRANFAHQPHILQADCARCHAGVETSKDSRELSFKGIRSCRECHRPSGTRQDCQFCHRYHPPAVP